MNELFSAADLFNEGSKTTKLPYGIHTEVSVKSVSRKETPNKNKFVEILFEKDGATIQKTLWTPKGDYPLKNSDGVLIETKEEATLRESKENLRHIAKLLGIFLPPEKLESFPNLNYENFIDKAITTLTPILNTKKVNLKVIYDSDGVYTELGRFPDYVELYQEGVEPTLKYSTYELQNRSTPKAKSAPKKNDLEELLGDSPM